MNGLSTADATARLAQVGPNALPERAPAPWWRRFWRQFQSRDGVNDAPALTQAAAAHLSGSARVDLPTSGLLGDASIPMSLWLVVFGSAGLSWALAEAVSRIVWQRPTSGASDIR